MDGGGTVLSLEAPLPHGEVTGLISSTVCPLASGFETPDAALVAVLCPGAVVASDTDTAQLTIITSLSGVRLPPELYGTPASSSPPPRLAWLILQKPRDPAPAMPCLPAPTARMGPGGLVTTLTCSRRSSGPHSSFSATRALAGCRVAAVFMQYGVVANYCWLLVEGVYLHSLLGPATFSERDFFTYYLGIGWGAPMLFVIPWAVVKSLFENVQCWTSNDNMGFWWILRFPVFLAILINFFIFIRILHILVAKLRAHQMRYSDYKLRLAKSTLTLIPLLGVHEVVFAFVTDEQAQGTLRSAKLFFDLFLSSFQGLLVAVLYCFLNKEVQAEGRRRWHRWRAGRALREERQAGSYAARAPRGPSSEKLPLSRGSQNPSPLDDPEPRPLSSPAIHVSPSGAD
ncbi:glucagon receptor [Pteropus vampyrus]|uniref:Glucagon receptor n=1 Tax=Pteropus vampyrus TaxID=132908 RepID=A0A6P3RD03_PTEVA|nr:glucagon receptor [Pteropus vampyrus]